MSGVWSIDGRDIETLDWEQSSAFGWWACAYGKPGPDGWRPIYWVERKSRHRFTLEIIDAHDGREDGGTFATLGAAQEAAESKESSTLTPAGIAGPRTT